MREGVREGLREPDHGAHAARSTLKQVTWHTHGAIVTMYLELPGRLKRPVGKVPMQAHGHVDSDEPERAQGQDQWLHQQTLGPSRGDTVAHDVDGHHVGERGECRVGQTCRQGMRENAKLPLLGGALAIVFVQQALAE